MSFIQTKNTTSLMVRLPPDTFNYKPFFVEEFEIIEFLEKMFSSCIEPLLAFNVIGSTTEVYINGNNINEIQSRPNDTYTSSIVSDYHHLDSIVKLFSLKLLRFLTMDSPSHPDKLQIEFEIYSNDVLHVLFYSSSN